MGRGRRLLRRQWNGKQTGEKEAESRGTDGLPKKNTKATSCPSGEGGKEKVGRMARLTGNPKRSGRGANQESKKRTREKRSSVRRMACLRLAKPERIALVDREGKPEGGPSGFVGGTTKK